MQDIGDISDYTSCRHDSDSESELSRLDSNDLSAMQFQIKQSGRLDVPTNSTAKGGEQSPSQTNSTKPAKVSQFYTKQELSDEDASESNESSSASASGNDIKSRKSKKEAFVSDSDY